MEDNLLNKPYDINKIHEVAKDVIDNLRVLAIDAQIFSLQYLCAVLHYCNYEVKTTTSAAEALEILSANKHGFDIVLVDVDSSNLNGFKLLKTIRQKMYLPVIMVTGDGSLENITKGLVHGAVDYIIKPVGAQKIKNTIKHRVTFNNLNPLEHFNASIKGKEDINIQSDSASSSNRKKNRVVWTPELDSKFLKAVKILEKSSMVHPKRILDIMNEPGLTRENVASHLQKYKLWLKKRKAETIQQGFASERVIRSLSTRSTTRIKWEVGDVNADRIAIPRVNRFRSFEDMNSVFLSQREENTDENTVMSQLMIPNGGSLVPDNPYQSLLHSCLDDPNSQTPDFKSFNYYNHGLEMNIQPHNHGSESVLETTSQLPYFHDVGSELSTPSSAPLCPSLNAIFSPETDVANLQSAYSDSSIPYLFSGGIPNYPGFTMNCTNNVQYPGSTDLTRNAEVPNDTMMSPTTDISSQHNLEREDEVSVMDYNQVKNSLGEGSFDFYSLFNDLDHSG